MFLTELHPIKKGAIGLFASAYLILRENIITTNYYTEEIVVSTHSLYFTSKDFKTEVLINNEEKKFCTLAEEWYIQINWGCIPLVLESTIDDRITVRVGYRKDYKYGYNNYRADLIVPKIHYFLNCKFRDNKL